MHVIETLHWGVNVADMGRGGFMENKKLRVISRWPGKSKGTKKKKKKEKKKKRETDKNGKNQLKKNCCRYPLAASLIIDLDGFHNAV